MVTITYHYAVYNAQGCLWVRTMGLPKAKRIAAQINGTFKPETYVKEGF